jgi:hypothetical protein
MTSKFSVHGYTHITVRESIIFLETKGPWNIEYFQDLHQELLTTVMHYKLLEYAVVLIPIGEAIAIPGVMEFHVEFISKGKAIAVAIDLSKCDTPHSTTRLCSEAYQSAQIEHEFFDDNTSAVAWLKTKMS